MGNRAVITNEAKETGVYLHWNGGRDSVEGFLKYCELQNFRGLTSDPTYGFARLTQVIANFFDGGLSVGVGKFSNLDFDNYDNGTYIVDEWKIVDRLYNHGGEQRNHNLYEFMVAIDEKQPKNMRLGKTAIKKELKAQNLYVEPTKE